MASGTAGDQLPIIKDLLAVLITADASQIDIYGAMLSAAATLAHVMSEDEYFAKDQAERPLGENDPSYRVTAALLEIYEMMHANDEAGIEPAGGAEDEE